MRPGGRLVPVDHVINDVLTPNHLRSLLDGRSPRRGLAPKSLDGIGNRLLVVHPISRAQPRRVGGSAVVHHDASAAVVVREVGDVLLEAPTQHPERCDVVLDECTKGYARLGYKVGVVKCEHRSSEPLRASACGSEYRDGTALRRIVDGHGERAMCSPDRVSELEDHAPEPLRGELVAAPESLDDWAQLLVERSRREGIALTGEGGLLTDLMRHVLQTGLEVEMSEHLGYGPHQRAGRSAENAHNGSYPKRVITDIGEVDLRVPRDRAGTFEPPRVSWTL